MKETTKDSVACKCLGLMRAILVAITGLVSGIGTVLPAAADRQSADYGLSTEELNSGGFPATDGATRMDGGLDLWIGTAASADVAVKGGFQGQIYAITGLTVQANPPTVDEMGSRALLAVGLYDDETKGTLEKRAQWQAISGPILGVDTNGVVSAGTVYHDTPATVQGTSEGFVGTLGLTVLDTLHDNYGFYAGDGVSDSWQADYFGMGNAAALADQDPDGDGQDNQHEFLAGTLPADGHSFLDFRIRKVDPDLLALSVYPAYTNRRYTVYATTRVNPTNWQSLVHTVTNTVGLEQRITDLDSTNGRAFYQVRIGYNWE